MIKFTTINVEGNEVKREFDDIKKVIINWYSDNCDLPSNDDEVIQFSIYDREIKEIKNFNDLMIKLQQEYWTCKCYR